MINNFLNFQKHPPKHSIAHENNDFILNDLKTSNSSFLNAIYQDNESSIRSFLKQGISLEDFNSAIEYAVFEKKENILKILFGYKAISDFQAIQNQIQQMPWFYEQGLLDHVKMSCESANQKAANRS